MIPGKLFPISQRRQTGINALWILLTQTYLSSINENSTTYNHIPKERSQIQNRTSQDEAGGIIKHLILYSWMCEERNWSTMIKTVTLKVNEITQVKIESLVGKKYLSAKDYQTIFDTLVDKAYDLKKK